MRKIIIILLSLLTLSLALRINHFQDLQGPQREGQPDEPLDDLIAALDRQKEFKNSNSLLTKPEQELTQEESLKVGLLTLKLYSQDPVFRPYFLKGIKFEPEFGWLSEVDDTNLLRFFDIVLSLDPQKANDQAQLDRIQSKLRQEPVLLAAIEQKFGNGDQAFGSLFSQLKKKASQSRAHHDLILKGI